MRNFRFTLKLNAIERFSLNLVSAFGKAVEKFSWRQFVERGLRTFKEYFS